MVDPEDFQTEAELQAHYGPEGPVAAANDWIEHILPDDLRGAWPATDPNLRLVLAHAWLWANREHPLIVPHELEATASALASTGFEHPLWPYFESDQLDEFHEAWPGFDLDKWGAASRPRPVPPDCELVIFIKTEGKVMMVSEPTVVDAAMLFLMRLADAGWRVAALSDQHPTPGWPPESPPPSLP